VAAVELGGERLEDAGLGDVLLHECREDGHGADDDGDIVLDDAGAC